MGGSMRHTHSFFLVSSSEDQHGLLFHGGVHVHGRQWFGQASHHGGVESNQVPGGTRLLVLCTWPYEVQFLQLQEPTDQTQLGSPTLQLYIFRGICKVLLAACSCFVFFVRRQRATPKAPTTFSID